MHVHNVHACVVGTVYLCVYVFVSMLYSVGKYIFSVRVYVQVLNSGKY